MNKITFKDIVKNYNELIEEVRKFDYFVRDAEIQKEKKQSLINLKSLIKNAKQQPIKKNDQKYANIFSAYPQSLSCQF